MSTNEQTTTLNELRYDCARQQKKGLHFILISVFIWAAIMVVHFTDLPIETKNILTFCVACPLMPLAWAISKVIHIDFQGKSNPLTSLGLIFSVNQILYILIAMWVFAAVPEKMLMVYSMIFGAQLALPVEELHDDVNCRAHPGTCPRTPFPALCPHWRHVLRGSHFLAMPDSGEQETEIE